MVMVIILLVFLFLLGFLHTFFYIPPHKLFLWFQSLFHLPTNKTTTTVLSKSITNKTTTATQVLVPKEEEEVEEKKKIKKIKKERLTTSDDLESVFATFDKNGDGFITKQELGEYLKNIGLFSSEKEVGNMVGKLDVNGDGLIDIDEFCDLYKSMWRKRSEAGHDFELDEDEDDDEEVLIREAFDVFDGDKDGLISVKELGIVLKSMGLLNQGGGVKDEEECKEMIRQVDLDGDGMVSFDEFKLMMNKSGRRGLVQAPS